MKSKITKIQILKKGIAMIMATMFLVTPITYATTSLDDSYLESSFWEQILYGEIGSTAKEIEEWFASGKTTLYITNETQLRALAEYVNSGNTCYGKEIILLNDIRVDSSREWIPIGKDEARFRGTFDGKGYTISGINFNRGDKLYSEIEYIGLFGFVYAGAVIKNVTISDSKFDIPFDLSSDITDITNDFDSEVNPKYGFVAAVAGYSSYASIENCKVTSTVDVNGITYVGGIAGYAWCSKITNCENEASLTGDTFVGGITGAFSSRINGLAKNDINYGGDYYEESGYAKIGKMTFCINRGDVFGYTSNIGGITGMVSRDSIVQSCENYGCVRTSTEKYGYNSNGIIKEVEPANVGGIAGCASGIIEDGKAGFTTIDGCINNGEVTGYRDVGGIVGQLGDVNGGNAIFINNINYSTNINATYGVTEAGYLVGEVGSYGDNYEISDDDSYIYMSNNLYYMDSEYLEAIAVDEDLESFTLSPDSTIQYVNMAADLKKAFYLDNEKNNESYSTVKLGYGLIIEGCCTESSSIRANNSADIIYFSQGSYNVIYNTTNENEILEKRLVDEGVIDQYNLILIEEKDGIDIFTNIEDIKVKSANDNAFVLDGKKWSINRKINSWNSDAEYIVDERTGTKVKYSIYKNNSEIKGTTYFKEGDIIKVKATFDKYLAQTYGPLSKITTAPTLKLNNSIEMDAGTVNATTSTYTTTIDYTYTVTSEDNFEITSLDLSKSGTMYAISNNNYSEEHPSISSINKSTEIEELIVDTTAPIINTKVYVENKLETDRYTAGKEIIFEVTTSEMIDAGYILPEIQVSFSESGVGKYNYNETKGAGYAKNVEARINLDGTTTWKYSYQVQEREEGILEFIFKDGEIVDLAGNRTNIKDLYTPSTDEITTPITGTEWSNDLNVTYEFYKNSVSEANKITSQTYFTEDDDLIVVATYNKVLYVHYGLSDGRNTNVRLTNSYKDRAPSLYLNGDSSLKQSSIERITTSNYVEATNGQEAKSGTTIVQYNFIGIAKNYNLKNLTQITKVVLKNENNTDTVSVNGTTASTNGLIPYSDKWYSTYNSEQEEEYNTTLSSGKIKTKDGLEDIIIDPVGVSERIEKSDIYADTTAPTVIITTDKTNPTNADLIIYTFKFSEKVEGFTQDDITVNNGIKNKETIGTGEEASERVKFAEVVEGLEYTLEVKPITANQNDGTVQVVVEEGACKDLVGINNIRKEDTIVIDKTAPTVKIEANKDKVEAGETIIYSFEFNEEVVEFTADDIIIENGTKGTFLGQEKYYTLEVVPENGNDVGVAINENVCTDIAGNGNVASSRHLISVSPTVTIKTNVTNPTNENTITYTFEWSEEVTGFDISDIILPNGVTGILNGNTMTINYDTIIPLGNVGEVTVAVKENAAQDANGNTNAYSSNTTKIDRISPVFIGLEAYVESNETSIKLDSEVDTVKQYYKTGEIVTIVATFTESIEDSTVPKLALQFSESGNAKGTVSSGTKDGNKITYTYTITDGDTGTLSVKGFSGKVVDAAGNETVVTKRGLDGDTVIADTKAPKLNELKVVSPSNGTYNANNTIKIEAIYDEEICALENNEIKLITEENVPVLKLKFGNGEERTATVVGYGKTDGKEDRTKLEYTYKIVDGDNGELKLVSYTNKGNVKVSDIAGNQVTLRINQTGNKITADTIRPEVTNITARIENPSVSNTGIYHKKDNVIKIVLTFSENIWSNVLEPKILIGFSESSSVEPTQYTNISYESNWNGNNSIKEYSYSINHGDNGYLWVKVPENQFKDNAGNGNIAENATKISNIFADTTDPSLTIYKDTEVIQDGQKITVRATFSENVYNLVDNARKTLSKVDAPKMVYGFGENGNLEASAYSVDGNVITYVITKENTMSGEFYHAYFKGNVYDRAGNPCFKDSTDTIAPVLESVEISSNAGRYAPYCKVGTEIYVTATFDEPIEDENMMLKAKVGEVEITELLDGEIVEEDNTKVKFTYIVKPGNMGSFEIVDISGKTDNTITEENADKTYGWVQDEHGNQNNIYNLSDEGVTVTGEAEADTKDPYITNIKAIADDKEVATYTKEEGKDPVITVGRTKSNILEYIVTYSEEVKYNHFDKIYITNGTIKSIEYTNSNRNEYKITVQTTVEGVQSLMINEGTVEDKAGNIDAFVRLDAVTVDFTKPTVRFISEYNGGVYVLPTNTNKVEIRPNVEISEDIAKIEYKWNDEDYVEIENYSVSSDIAVPTKAFTDAGTYKLYIKVVDLAGNIEETSKTYKIVNSNIDITLSTEELTNQDVIATVKYDEELEVLTDNRKVTFKSESSNEAKEIVANEDGNYTISENGILYVEATDRVGNKVYVEKSISNIDKDPANITCKNRTFFTNEEFEFTMYSNELAKISYSWDKTEWITTEDYVTELKVSSIFTEPGKNTLYVKSIDKASNESVLGWFELIIKAFEVEIVGNSEDWTNEDIVLQISANEEIASIKVNEEIIDANEGKYIVTENGDYEIIVTDTHGNEIKRNITVSKIDKVAPAITKIEASGENISITATDIVNEKEGSGIAKYAITNTTEVPVEWSESNVIKTAKDGAFYVWVKDKVGNIARSEEVVTVDTTAPTITFNYLSQTITVGMPLEANIVTDEDAIISYSWDKENWVDSEELIASLNVFEKTTTPGTYTLYVKAKDEVGNESKIQILEFTVLNIEEIRQPEIIFEDISTIQINGVKYVKVSPNTSIEYLTNRINQEALCGKTPEFIKLTEEGKLKTGSEITINGETKFVVVVKGDVNSDGEIDFVKDIIRANNYRLGIVELSIPQILATDINDNGKVEFIQDIIAINNFRLGLIKSL